MESFPKLTFCAKIPYLILAIEVRMECAVSTARAFSWSSPGIQSSVEMMANLPTIAFFVEAKLK
jgi:hypothetical protein